MKQRFKVVFANSVKVDIATSFEWGCNEWGEEAARRWYRNLRESIRKILAQFPLSQPLAPEDENEPFELRQMIIGRYRVLYMVEGRTVRILHLRGAFTDDTSIS